MDAALLTNSKRPTAMRDAADGEAPWQFVSWLEAGIVSAAFRVQGGTEYRSLQAQHKALVSNGFSSLFVTHMQHSTFIIDTQSPCGVSAHVMSRATFRFTVPLSARRGYYSSTTSQPPVLPTEFQLYLGNNTFVLSVLQRDLGFVATTDFRRRDACQMLVDCRLPPPASLACKAVAAVWRRFLMKGGLVTASSLPWQQLCWTQRSGWLTSLLSARRWRLVGTC